MIRLATCAALSLALLPALALAADAPSYAELLRQAQTAAPRLAEQAADIETTRGQAEQAAVRPNPVVGLDAENIGAKDSGGVSQLETTLSVTQTLELGQKRAARVGAANLAVEVAQARATLGRTEFAYDLAIAYAAAEATARRVRLAREATEASAEDLRIAQALVEAGKEADLRAVQARA
jgi:outer membrane protein, heavy metal efflux system